MRYLFYFLSLFIFVLLGALLGAPNTNAQSVYDDIIETATPPYRIGNHSSQNSNELGQAFVTLFPNNNQNAVGNCSYDGNWNYVINGIRDGQPYSIMQAPGNTIWLTVNMSPEPFSTTEWREGLFVYQDFGQDNDQTYAYNLTQRSNGDYIACGGLGNGLITTGQNNLMPIGMLQSRFGSPFHLIEYFGFQLTYPPDYQGETPEDVPPSKTPLDYWVNYSYQNTPSILRATYLNKRTDPVSSLPDPVQIYWRLLVDAPIVTEGGSLVCEANRPVSVPFDTYEACPEFKPDETKEYYLYAQINPIRNPELNDRPDYQITFKVNVFKIDFSKSSVGSTEACEPGAILDFMNKFCVAPETIDFTKCFSENFPWVDPFECGDNFRLIFQFLAFGGIRFPEWSHEPQCKSLNTMDDWLGLPNSYTACPMFPSNVRNIITPFIAFLLGIVTLGFIQRHNNSGGF